MMNLLVARTRALCVVLTLMLAACGPLMSAYSLETYKSATTLKAEIAALVDDSDEPFSDHADEVRTMQVKLDAAYEYSAGVPNNELSAAQWNLLRGDTLFAGFVSHWQVGGMTELYRSSVKEQISEAFDEIICLEVNKKERKRCSAQEAVS